MREPQTCAAKGQPCVGARDAVHAPHFPRVPEGSRRGQSLQTESRLVVAGGQGEEEGGEAANGHGGAFSGDEMFWKRRWGRLHNPVHVLETAELCPLRGRTVRYVN